MAFRGRSAFNGHVPGPLPEGQPAPGDGTLPPGALQALAADAGLSWYLHVPFCRTRCGYCDFNTYTASELGPGVSAATWADTASAEVRLARRVLDGIDAPAPTVFFGGGTPSQLPPADLGKVLRVLRGEFGVLPDAEITVEANPDDVTDELLDGLLSAGVNRISLGMQSAVPQTLALLQRTHRHDDLPQAVRRIRRSGVRSLSVDLIYGSPGESAEQWRQTLQAALALEPDHISAYCLGIEEGTRLGAQVRAGILSAVDPDAAADRYEACDELLAAHGLRWYEISNWARPGQECRHNLAYWRSRSWWGAGPGAHSHVGGVRWWNRRHPRAWTASLAQGASPAEARETLTAQQQRDERVLLGIRLAEGLPAGLIRAATVQGWVSQGAAEWIDGAAGAFRLTRSGRLIADRLALEGLSESPVNIAEAAQAPYTGTRA